LLRLFFPHLRSVYRAHRILTCLSYSFCFFFLVSLWGLVAHGDCGRPRGSPLVAFYMVCLPLSLRSRAFLLSAETIRFCFLLFHGWHFGSLYFFSLPPMFWPLPGGYAFSVPDGIFFFLSATPFLTLSPPPPHRVFPHGFPSDFGRFCTPA